MATTKKTAKKAPAKKAAAKKTNGKKASAKKAAAAKKPRAVAAAPKAGTKTEQLMMLLKDGATVDRLCEKLGWQAHTLRAALTRLPGGAKAERTREEGVTTYKLA